MFTEHDQFTRNKSKPLSAPLKVWPLKNETAKQQPSALRTGLKRTGMGGKLKKKTLLPKRVKQFNDVKAIDSGIVTYAPGGEIL